MSTRKLVIAIDGPAGSGKSTIAAQLAKKLGYVNLESGAMYRAVALRALENKANLDDEDAIRQLAERTNIELIPRAEGNRVLMDGRDVSQRVREADVSAAASRVSVHSSVRRIMVARQRAMGEQGGVIMEGRDIGTVVFPNADVKIFLDADEAVRAERRLLQNAAAAESAQQVKAELADRDRRDQTRAASPLIAAPDAVHIDSTHKSIDKVVADIAEVLQHKLAAHE
jgi:cytidylate kinase